MRHLILGACLALVLSVAAEEKKLTLLGADDVDKKHALMTGDKPPEVPESIVDVRRKAKADRFEFKSLKHRVHDLKRQIKDGKATMPKSEIKTLKQEYVQLKESMKSKKHEIVDLKKKIFDLKAEKRSHKQDKKGSGRLGGRKNKQEKKNQLIGAEEKKLNSPESFGLKAEPQLPTILSKKDRKAQRKLAKKAERRRNRQKETDAKDETRPMSKDMPKLRNLDISKALPFRNGGGHRFHKRKLCETNDDCVKGKCIPNSKGRKVCQVTDKTAGQRCHKSEACARGLKCYVSQATAILPGKQAKRTKGVCAEPSTADTTKGFFIPYKS